MIPSLFNRSVTNVNETFWLHKIFSAFFIAQKSHPGLGGLKMM